MIPNDNTILNVSVRIISNDDAVYCIGIGRIGDTNNYSLPII